jgi:hypothetical protein
MATAGPGSIDRYCTFLFHTEKAAAVQQEEIIKKLESSEPAVSGNQREEER